MKKVITIYTNFTHKKFLINMLSNFKLNFKRLEEANYSNLESDKVLFFLPKEIDKSLFKKYLGLKNALLIIPQNIINLNENKSISILIYPTTIDKFKGIISQMFFFRKEIFDHLEIHDQKILNKVNNKFCFLTNLEKEIFMELVHKKLVNRRFLEENILNINSRAETHSLDSHLSRIRKKLQNINSKVRIISRGTGIILEN